MQPPGPGANMTDADVFLAMPQGAGLDEPNHVMAQVSPEAAMEEFSPFAYAELYSTSGSETTCNSAVDDKFQFSCRNVVRFIPIPNYANRPFLHLEIEFCEPGQKFLVRTLDGTQGLMTLGEILRLHSDVIDSIAFDATAFPDPELPSAMVGALILPFSPRAVTSEVHLHAATSGSLPFFPALKDISITTSRAVSIASLLDFLHFCPMLKSLAIYNAMRHKCVLPESTHDMAEPSLPHLSEVIIDGLLTSTTENLLNKLAPSLNENTRVQTHLYDVSFPVLQHGSALCKLFSPIRHVNMSYTVFPVEDPEPKSALADLPGLASESKKAPWCLFTCSDVASRVRLNWHWKPISGIVPNLMHIGLANPAFEKVHTLSLSFHNVRPVYYDLFYILQSFCGVSHIEVHSLLPASADTLKPESELDSQTNSEAGSLTGLLSNHESQSDKLEPANITPQSVFLSRHSAFKLRAAPVLRKLVRLPTLLATELTQLLHEVPTGANLHPPSSSPPFGVHCYPSSALGRVSSTSLNIAISKDDAHLPPHVRELAAIVNPPLLFAMETAHERGAAPAPPSPMRLRAQAKAAARKQIPAHMRRLARFYYDPLWALMVRDRS